MRNIHYGLLIPAAEKHSTLLINVTLITYSLFMSATKKLTAKIIAGFVACLLFVSSKAQEKDSSSYAIVIKFSSIGMGVPDDKPLRNYIISFRKKNKVKKIVAKRIGPMGKEGEYWLAFSLKELSKKQKASFKTQLKAVTAKMKDGGGQVDYEENVLVIRSALGRAFMADVSF